MRAIGLVFLVLLGNAAFAADNDARIAALVDPPARNWQNVEDIAAAADAAPATAAPGRYAGDMQDLLLAPDGRMAIALNAAAIAQVERHGGQPRGHATLGTWTRDGEWLVLAPNDFATGPSTKPPTPAMIAAYREQLKTYYDGMSEDEALDMAEAMVAEFAASAGSNPAGMFGEGDNTTRLLVVDTADGTLLVDGDGLLQQTQRWSGEGELDLYATHWRANGAQSAYAQPRERGDRFTLADPMHASVPLPLRSLLRPQVIEARVVGLVEPDKAIEWKAHEAEVRLRLDRGADDGLLADMWMYGVPPNERLFSRIESVSAKESVLLLQVSRFAPHDTPDIPAKGTVVASRTQRAIACGFDARAAVRASVTAVRLPEGGVKRDEEGFAFVELEIDQGAHHGLALDDEFAFDGDDVEGEGRVRRLGETNATVLWRVERDWEAMYAAAEAAHETAAADDADVDDASIDDDEDALLAYAAATPVVLPAVGQHLVTPSWQAAERDVFGKTGNTGPSSPLLVD